MSNQTVIQCLLFVLDKETEYFALIPSVAVKERANVCQLFERNNIKILNNDKQYPLLLEALERDQVKILELIATSCVGAKVYTFTSKTTPFIPVGVQAGSEEFVRQLFGKDAAVYPNIYSHNRSNLIKVGHSKILERLFACRADIRCLNPPDETLLHLSAKSQNEFIVELLLKYDVNVDARSNDGSTALHMSCENDRLTITSLLLEKGKAAVNARREDGSTSLLLAIKKHRLSMVRFFLKNEADVNVGNYDGLTPLHAAAKIGNLEIVNELLEQSANVNAVITYRHAKGVTPLCVAVEGKHLIIVKRLLDKGADPNMPCYDYQSIIELAYELKRDDMIECLLKYHWNFGNQRDKKLFYVREFQDHPRNITKLLTEYRLVVVEAVDRYDSKLLDDAICKNDYVTVKQLLEKGVNANKVYCHYHTYSERLTMPLFTALHHRRHDIVKLLISFGADFNAMFKFDERKTSLTEAVRASDAEALRILQTENIEFSAYNEGQIISVAIEKKSLELLEEVLCKRVKSGASVHSIDSDGDTELHLACVIGYPEVVKYFIQNNADVEARNFEGQTPILAAVNSYRLDNMIELLKYGASIDVMDDAGFSPIHHACCKSYKKIFEALLQFHFRETKLIQRTNIYQIFRVSYIESLPDSEFKSLLHSSYSLYGLSSEWFADEAETLARHMIKLKAAFPCDEEVFNFCSETNLRSVSNGKYLMPRGKTEPQVWLDFQHQCDIEVLQLKSLSIGDSCATYYDVLTKSEQIVACYLRNAVIFQTLKSKEYETKFPIYAKILSYQFEKGLLRRNLLNKGVKQYHLLVSVFKNLPLNLKEEVLSHLSTRELEVAVYACSRISNRQ